MRWHSAPCDVAHSSCPELPLACTSIMPAMGADIPRARSVQSCSSHAEHCWCSVRLAVLPVTGEDAQMRGGAERAQRRLSEMRVGWPCSAACRLGIAKSRGQSSARFWVTIWHVGVHHPCHGSWLLGLAVAVWVVVSC